jgi:hypothetical protein
MILYANNSSHLKQIIFFTNLPVYPLFHYSIFHPPGAYLSLKLISSIVLY